MKKIKEIVSQNLLFTILLLGIGTLIGFAISEEYRKDTFATLQEKPFDNKQSLTISGDIEEYTDDALKNEPTTGASLDKKKLKPVDFVYVASKTGTNYYLPWCSGAKKLKEKNKIYFDTMEQAESAGYRANASCPELIAEKGSLETEE